VVWKRQAKYIIRKQYRSSCVGRLLNACVFYASWYKQKKMEVVENERDLLQQADRVASLSECFTWLQQCDECIEWLEERSRAKRPRFIIGQSLVARIALEDAKTRLQRCFMPSGGDYVSISDDDNAERFIWQDIDTAFENRILTGVIINLYRTDSWRMPVI